MLPELGDVPLRGIHNLTVKPLVDRMKKSLSTRTVNKYGEYIGQVVASLKDGRTGEPWIAITPGSASTSKPMPEPAKSIFQPRSSTAKMVCCFRPGTARRTCTTILNNAGFHAFRRFRKTWLRGEPCQEDTNNFLEGAPAVDKATIQFEFHP